MVELSIKKRYSLSKSGITELTKALSREIGPASDEFLHGRIERAETNTGMSLFIIDRKILLFSGDGWVFPTLKGALTHPFASRRVVVDMGAVPYVAKGADVMRPGIVSYSDDFKEGDPVHVVEERHGKTLAIGKALICSELMSEHESGKVIKNLHHIGDPLWNLEL